jgi:hypothetical protein
VKRVKKPKETVKSLKTKLDVVADANFQLHNRMNGIDNRARELQDAMRAVRTEALARRDANIRRAIATHMLSGMIASCPLTDRTKVDRRVWAGVAYEFADALIDMESKANNKQGVWMDRGYVDKLARLAASALQEKPARRHK